MRFLQKNWPKSAKHDRGSCSKKTLPRIGGHQPVPSLSSFQQRVGYSNVLHQPHLGLHPWQGRKHVHAIHDNYYLTKVWVFKISKRVFLLQTLWLSAAQGTFFFPEREGLNLSLLILHSHLGFNFWYISCPEATLLQLDQVYCASLSKGLLCLYILKKWRFGRVSPIPHIHTNRQQNIVLLSLSKV